jgi:hypothetical protein
MRSIKAGSDGAREIGCAGCGRAAPSSALAVPHAWGRPDAAASSRRSEEVVLFIACGLSREGGGSGLRWCSTTGGGRSPAPVNPKPDHRSGIFCGKTPPKCTAPAKSCLPPPGHGRHRLGVAPRRPGARPRPFHSSAAGLAAQRHPKASQLRGGRLHPSSIGCGQDVLEQGRRPNRGGRGPVGQEAVRDGMTFLPSPQKKTPAQSTGAKDVLPIGLPD